MQLNECRFITAALGGSTSSMRALEKSLSSYSDEELKDIDVKMCYLQAVQLVYRLEPLLEGKKGGSEDQVNDISAPI